MVRGGRPLLRENVAETDPTPSKTPISNRYLLLVPQAVTPSKKVQLTI